jgi:hypothetical protein
MHAARLANVGRLVTGGSLTSPAPIRHRVSVLLVLVLCAFLPWLVLVGVAALVWWVW